MSEILACLTCETVIPIFNNSNKEIHEAPEFFYDPVTGDVTEFDKDDFAEFKKAHQEHGLVRFTVVAGPYSHQKFSEPVAEKFYSVQRQENGKPTGEIVVLKKCREKINDPMRYELFRGWIESEVESIDIDFEAIIKQLAPKVDHENLEIFIQHIKTSLEYEDSHLRHMLEEGPEPFLGKGDAVLTDHPLTIMIRPISLLTRYWYDRSRDFCWDYFRLLHKFIEQESKPNGLLALAVKFRFTVHETNDGHRD